MSGKIDVRKILEEQGMVPKFLSMPFETRLKYLIDDLYQCKMKERIEKLKKRT